MDFSQFLTTLPSSLQGLLGNNIFATMVVLPLLLIVLDVITGIGSAIRRGVFSGKNFADFLGNDVIRYVGASFLIFIAYITRGSIVATTLAGSLGFFPLSISIITSIFTNVREMLSPQAFAQLETAAAAIAGLSDPSTLSPQGLQAQYAFLTAQFNQQQQLQQLQQQQQAANVLPPTDLGQLQSSSLPVPQPLSSGGSSGTGQ